ncbi:HTTM domain-containing protein [Maribacter sp. MMG018]|uniref:HTTM domain-containing protein n=1 Tax=Maribacter sp. MMG018 TaxID=2822688 RepID=UPI001B374856|nr:HTTM domain-containing protein [Maribacter sp. MMG018]MBQ4913779.1 HTTM domain-containing protein [Maribacter sp. MMG018]
MLNRLLFQKIDNSPLIIFRIFFGILVSLECFGAIATGWVRRNLVEPQYTFPFIDFAWLETLAGPGMYFYFFAMGCLGIFIALGYKYRISSIAFTVLWTGSYLMQKGAYNNHYYLLILISFLMCFFPASTDYSLDVKYGNKPKENSMYGYVKWAIVLQLFIVYTYASIAKMYGDWLDFGMIKILMKSKADYFLVGELLQQPWIHKIIGSVGILFDLLVVPALLWKPTRKIAFYASIFFHLFNSFIFQIGIFPYLSLAFSVFFFEPETIRKIFFKRKTPFKNTKTVFPKYKNAVLLGFCCYFTLQLLLPIRHHFIKDDVLWTEEGHRMSWRMMLRSRSGKGKFKVIKKNGKEIHVSINDYLTKSQKRKVFSHPDFAWQFAQYLKKEFSTDNETVAVYLVNSKVSINGRPYTPFIDPEVNLADTPWKPLEHSEWILPSKLEDQTP